ncbi:hypothetical protein YC2023_054355 [Brassica napus]|uniref:(rape) hypothetical protein n=1 Tax=Brassica napus TaxID=3708 RepID=A0A816JPH2_BRANA|nr:unnamed protein product [Brassica napus]
MAEVENKSHETWIPRVEAEGLPQRFASRIVELILLLSKRSSSQDKELQDGKVSPPGGSLLSYIHSAPPLKLGIAIVNDFKSVEGDRAMGLQSLPVAFGTEAAKWICVSVIDATQLSVAGM